MKIMFASDIHGSYYAAQSIKTAFEREESQRLVLLGDLLYHGPRNPLPQDYNPQKVAELLNTLKENIICVRGNCDSEVDQMLLDFPIIAPYALLEVDSYTMFFTHGHIYNDKELPPLRAGDIFINGHTHIPLVQKSDKHIFLNPGSCSLPKQSYDKSYMIYEDGIFSIKTLDGNVFMKLSIR